MTDRSAPLSPAVFHILLALADGACHGYEIMTRVNESSGRKAGPGTVYGSIQRMEEAGLLSEVPAPEEQSGRRRRFFELTGAGERALRQEARRLTHLADLVRERELLAEGAGGSK